MRLIQVLAVLGLVAGLAACGDDSTTVEPTESTVVEPTDDPGESDPDADLPGEDFLEPLDDGPPSTIAPPAGYEALCDIGLDLWPLVQSFGELDQPAADTAALYEEMAGVIEGHLPSLPDGPVADDSRLLLEGIQLIAEVLGDYQSSFAEAMADPELESRLAPVFDDGGQYNEAGDRWDDALEENCGLVL